MAADRLLSDMVRGDAVDAARATSKYAEIAGANGDVSACYRYQAYRLLSSDPDVAADDRSGGGKRVQLNACLVRAIHEAHPPRSADAVTGFKRAGANAAASPKRQRR